ncbi:MULTISPECIES: 16S rRNA (uracil(1498)-N(3))-methyltransferase [unclassified Coleofasciculus]|uniref:16S rRNA (uracil(1498)-N(3))-methyltransferase n=1 Tax=unclassified Coleofasciculus TaxID=2692782 RepID=UPI001881AE85|nr:MULTISPECIES: 16S rRNA (uracil(1498)-N(3))-methyltransferase [unclassified Coleofasciculus]MBE9127235.1 16S rRNA (uracil(1498)-N(3))-methyltransferase [Coleofasciculus sp. LEGE 07081]MBE9150527.1 16S rRNA (uracil(1498)-N(3))-methyltransferase [Coleofasciculus sp. LEGE 07092]
MAQLQRLVIAPAQRQNQQLFLTDAQQHYLVRVLRLGKGDRFIAMDGQGSWYISELTENLTQAIIIESLCVQTELPLSVTLMVAMPKGSGFEQVVSGATELGVGCIVPLKSDRTLLNPSSQKLERWRRIAREAAEQSERQIVPTILEPISFAASIQPTSNSNTHCYICVARGDAPHLLSCLPGKDVLLDTSQSDNFEPVSIVIAIGPEGGWSAAEVEQATASGYQPVSLGHRVLRAVTAPIVALSLVASVLEIS